MMKRMSLYTTVALLFMTMICGCASPGGYTLVEDKRELPTIPEEYSKKFTEIYVGMSPQSLYELFPYLYVKDQRDSVIAYELVDYETYVTQDDIDHQNFWYGSGTPKPRTLKRVLWFYFHNSELVKWDKPHRWPDVFVGVQEPQEMAPIVQATDLVIDETESDMVESPTLEVTESDTVESPSPTTTKNGTCFAISENGVLVTAYHIVKEATTIKVYTQQGAFESAEVVLFDAMNDLAVLKIEAETPNFLQIAPLQTVQEGETVFTIGFPTLTEGQYSEGIVGPTFNSLGASSLLQINVPVESGHSGGALVNIKGFVVGIITSTEVLQPILRESVRLPEDVNWAIKSDYLRLLVSPPDPQEQEMTAEQIIQLAQMSTFPVVAE